jgi:glycosyltransferase involved in cell wall biosynthesis
MLTIVIPCYNEETIIHDNAVRVADALEVIEQRHGVRSELVVLDDGSTDATSAEVERARLSRPRIRGVRADGPSRRENLAAFMVACDSEYVGWMDADLSTSLDRLEDLVLSAPRHDIVTGSRYLPSSRIRRTPQRLLISRTYNWMIRAMYGSRMSDHWCGFKIFRREALARVVDRIGLHVEGRKMFWDAQMWVAAQRLGLDILEIPVSWHEGEKSALKLHTEIPMMVFTFRYWLTGDWRATRPVAEPAVAPLTAA